MQKHIFLIGYMGSGKTTIGKKLSNKLNIPFIDTDAMVEEKEKSSIASIFKTKGEDYFRTLEQKCLNDLSLLPRSIISTGGGFPCFNDNISLMKAMGVVVYLERGAKELTHRLVYSKKERPLLSHYRNAEELFEHIEQQLELRRKYYEQANLILDRSMQGVEEIIQHLDFYDKNTLG